MNEEKEETQNQSKENWFKKHVDTVIILGAFSASILWMNGKFNDIDKKFHLVDKQFSEIHEQITVIKTVLLIKNILPSELAKIEGEK